MSFKRLEAEDFLVSADAVQSVAWSTGLPILTSFFTSSAQRAGTTGNYYLSVYDVDARQDESECQFQISYGNKHGLGSTPYNYLYPQYSPSSTIYGQYRSMILEDENAVFITGVGATGQTTVSTSSAVTEMKDFWVITPDRARYKQSMFPGTFNLHLDDGNNTLHLTDNSNDTTLQSFLGSSKVYQLISGSDGTAKDENNEIMSNGGYTESSGSYGLFFPDLGVIMLNPDAINTVLNSPPEIDEDVPNGENNLKAFTLIKQGKHFQLNASETITSDYIFIRSRNSEFNYSENPSFISGSTGEIIYDTFINNPQVYPTTVGLYNDANELMAVAKLSKPLLKDFTKESLIRVKLDF